MTPQNKSLSSLRKDLDGTLRSVVLGKTYRVARVHGGEVVLMSRTEYDRLVEDKTLERAIAIGKAELDAGLGIPHAEVVARLKRSMSKWKSSGRPKRRAK
jgi:hypothetical protein